MPARRQRRANPSVGETVVAADRRSRRRQRRRTRARTSAKIPVEEPKEEAKQEKAEAAAPKAQDALPAETPPEPKQAELVDPKAGRKTDADGNTGPEKARNQRDQRKIREAARHAKDDGESLRDRAAPSSPPSNASSSIGRGRSDLDTNYHGIVAAHLARYKQMPSSVQSGTQGTVAVTFSLSGSGSVGSVRLARGSGISAFDQEAQAMVRRASPFPAPPSGRAQSFTVPVAFHMR